MQPGPICFKTPRKCGIFGVCCEGVPRQVNFLIDESVMVGKSANATISYLHFYLEKHGLGETDAMFHADNCGVQNKNKYFLWYFAWRVMHGLRHRISYSFLIAGHTKFAPDQFFGLLKQKFKKSYVSSLYELAEVDENSSTTGVNVAQLVGRHDGKVEVPVHNWIEFLTLFFKPLPGIKKRHHFRFDRHEPGAVYYKVFNDSKETALMLLKTEAKPPRNLTTEVKPQGQTELFV